MASYVTKIRTEDGDMQIDYRALANKPTADELGAAPIDHVHTLESIGAAATEHSHTKDQITDFPDSLPANGGNADTLGGKQADEFALVFDVEQLKTQVEDMSLESFGVTVTTDEINHLKGVTDNIQTQLDNKSNSDHEHDDKYYTELEVDSLLANKANTFASGITILSSYQYGPTLPEDNSEKTIGRIFFKRVTSQ